MTTNGRVVEGKGTKPEAPLGSLINTGKDVLHGYQEAIDQAIKKSMAIREAEAKFGTPGTAGIEVRHEGVLRWENPQDRKRYDALKANRDRAILTARHLNDLGGFAADLSDDLQPIGELLTNVSMKVLTGTYTECLKFLTEMGFQEIAQATKPEQQQQ
jgi:hypothetical protein